MAPKELMEDSLFTEILYDRLADAQATGDYYTIDSIEEIINNLQFANCEGE